MYDRNHPNRAMVEQFVQRAFALRHGASVRTFMPTLLALEGRDNQVCGVAGFRNAGDEQLFLEHYLDEPAELALSRQADKAVRREQIVEIGNLASLSCRAAFHLVALLPRLLLDRSNLWVVFTATRPVRELLGQFRAPLIDLGKASREWVAGLEDDWGRYYDADPRVMAGYLPDGLAMSFARTAR